MRSTNKEEFAEPAKSNFGLLEYERGYLHGERSRELNEVPPKYVMTGIDEYAFGFRAGYFAGIRATPSAGHVDR